MTCSRPAIARVVSRVSLMLLLLGLISPGLSSQTFQAHDDKQDDGKQDDKKHDDKKDPRKSYALIVGTVWGPDDRPVYGIKVKIRRADQRKAKWELYSNHTGEFAQRLPAGKADYIVQADTKGLKLLNGKRLGPGTEVTVHVESEERVDIGLHLKE